MIQTGNGWWITDDDAGSTDPQLFTAEHIGVARAQIERVLPFVRRARDGVAIQAGGRCGLWPVILAEHFAQVVTLEPDPDNYRCLCANIAPHLNVRAHQRALGPSTRRQRLMRGASGGLHYLAPAATDEGVEVDVITVDSLRLEQVAALFLDVEGYEREVLVGAGRTLERDRPVVVVEENALLDRYGRKRGDVAFLLEAFGYRVVGEFYTLPDEVQHDGQFRGSDLIFCAP